MKHVRLILAGLLATAGGALAQPAIPAAVPAAAGPAQNVNVSNKCCSIWDFLGVQQLGSFVNNQVCKTQLGTAFNTALAPLARALGLGPSLLSNKFAKEGGVMGLANQLKKEEKKVPLKVQAIKYLATLDCQCYPEIVDALLGSLDDCSEKVRYAALEALANKCGKKGICKHLCGHKDKQACGTCDTCTNGNCPPCDCPGCMCQKKVMDRLNSLLLERDEFGCLKEKSERIRCLATEMIERCLIAHQPHPGVMSPDESPVKPDPAPPVNPDPMPPAGSTEMAPMRIVPNNVRKLLPSWFGGNKAEEQAPIVTEPAGHEEIELNDSTEAMPAVTPHQVGYRGPALTGGKPIMVTPPKNSWGEPRRHLVGEIFGY